jgi:polyisoprenoid-binding protein YceI
MRKNALLFLMAVILFACQSIPKGDTVVVGLQQPTQSFSNPITYTVDTSYSKIIWTGTKPVGQHTGTFQLADGGLNFEFGTINGGKFTIDIHSLTNTDLQGASKKRLEEHIKSTDFFDVQKYPTAVFEITKTMLADVSVISVVPNITHSISGNLTLKGVTKNVTFPAAIRMANNILEVKANFNIDRTAWGLNYGSEKSLQDRFIHPTVNIELDIKANRILQ